MRSKVAAVLTLALILLAGVSLPARAATGKYEITLTVYPGGSVQIAESSFVSEMLPVGTLPGTTSHLKATTSGGLTTISVNETESVPSEYLDQAPFNYSISLTASGVYADGTSTGIIVVQAVPGVSVPGATLTASYSGDSNSISASGNVTLQYGTYGSSPDQVVLNSVTIAQDLQMLEKEGLNSSSISSELAKLDANYSQANLALTSFSIVPSYGADGATVEAAIKLTGNMTALPFAVASLYIGLLSSELASLSSTAGITETSQLSQFLPDLFEAYSAVTSSIQSYAYTMSYASGIFALSEKLVATQNLNLDQAMAFIAKFAAGEGTRPSEVHFLNTTKVDISSLSESVSEAQKASGEYDINSSAAGLTLYPQVTESGGLFNESSLLDYIGTTPVNITVLGGTNSEGSVKIVVPSGVPPPTESAATRSVWTNVNASDLAGLEFSVAQASTTSSSSSSSSTSSTSSSSTSTSKGGIPEFPPQLGFSLLVTIAIVASYVLTRRGLQTGKRTPS